jgi:hypothetical protein
MSVDEALDLVLACPCVVDEDFFTVDSVFLRRYYALFFIIHASRPAWTIVADAGASLPTATANSIFAVGVKERPALAPAQFPPARNGYREAGVREVEPVRIYSRTDET